jgi:putative DNA primase/helicase
MTIRELAQAYIDEGWAVVPLRKGEKRASTPWQKRTYTAGKCGSPSAFRVDIDLDSREAVAAAARLMPDTPLVHGRPGKPLSHFWVICEDAKTTQFTDVRDASGKTAMLAEIRSDGGYTMLPPSIHPSGEVLAWARRGTPLRMNFEDVYACVRDVSIAALVARHWPGSGARHSMVGPLAGLLCSAGIDGPQVVRIIETAALVANDSDVHDRVNFAA